MLGFDRADESAPPAPPVPPVPAAGDRVAGDGPRPDVPRSGVLVGRDVEEHGLAPATPGSPDAPPAPPAPVISAVEPSPDRTLVEALHRVADSFERVAASLDADRRERRGTIDDIDALLRTLVGELRSPSAVAPVVVAGTIDLDPAAAPPPLSPGEPTVDLAAAERVDERRPFQRSRRR
jgi:hypothetical protein